MKRCPECLFIYPDADTKCDFDGTALVTVNEAELEAATTQPQTTAKRKRTSNKNSPKPKKPSKKRQRKATAITAVIGLLLGVAAFFVFYRFTHRAQQTAQLKATQIASAEAIPTPISTPALVATPSPSPTATPTTTTRSSTDRVATAHTSTTVTPISTSGLGMGKKPGGKPIILLTSGSKLEADEVWRTRDGVWYRRNGIVTLLKRGQVKAIVNQ